MSPQGGAGRGDDTTVEMFSPPEGRDTERRSSRERTEDNESRDGGEDSVDGGRANEELQELAGQSHYQIRKNAVHAIMNVPLLTANVSQLRLVYLTEEDEKSFRSCVLGLVIASLILQLVFFFLILALHLRERCLERRERKKALQRLKSGRGPYVLDGKGGRRLSYSRPASMDMTLTAVEVEPSEDRALTSLNCVSLCVVFFITVINMFILGFINIPKHNSDIKKQ